MDFENNEEILIQDNICKSISGEEDKNGNYIFEVEASNENLDLQNQITLQSALLKSKEYFLSNGVISDDHLHKTRNPDGSVESHKDKIIGEPISIRTDGKSTFVKGLLYKGVEAAKPYIDLLKNHSSRVKASIGGIMPKVIKNTDGSETVTSFMWNDLALTCSPVNWTVGSAKFAKSIGIVDFCKSLNAGSGSNCAEYSGGRTLQNEDMEKETVKIMDITDGNLTGENANDDFNKSKKNIIRDCIVAIDTGELINRAEIENFLIERGFDKDKARETTLEIISQGGNKMQKSHFSSTIEDLLKSIDGDENAEKDEKIKKNPGDEEDNIEPELDLDDDSEMDDEETEDTEEVEKGCGVQKSLFDDNNDDEYLDATELMKSMGEHIDLLTEKNEQLEKSLEEVQQNLIEVTKSFSEYLKTPNARNTIMQKSVGANDSIVTAKGPAKRPTTADLDVLNKALVNASHNGKISLDEVQFYTTEFQKSMKGIAIKPATWEKICNLVKENR